MFLIITSSAIIVAFVAFFLTCAFKAENTGAKVSKKQFYANATREQNIRIAQAGRDMDSRSFSGTYNTRQFY